MRAWIDHTLKLRVSLDRPWFLVEIFPMKENDFDCICALKALGEESRLRILRLLLERPHSVGEIATAISLTSYNASKHLRILKEAGLVEMEKNAQQRVYAIAPDFSSHLKKKQMVLDLGCCSFNFDKLPT